MLKDKSLDPEIADGALSNEPGATNLPSTTALRLNNEKVRRMTTCIMQGLKRAERSSDAICSTGAVCSMGGVTGSARKRNRRFHRR